MTQVMCYGRYHDPVEGSIECVNMNKAVCPIVTGQYKKLMDLPCCLAIFIPNRFITEADRDLKKAARKYLEECVLLG